MGFSRNMTIFGLLVAVLMSNVAESIEMNNSNSESNQSTNEILNAGLPETAGFALIALPPVGELLARGLFLTHEAFTFTEGLHNSDDPSSQLMTAFRRGKSQNRIVAESKRIIDEMTHIAKSPAFLRDMRLDLEKLQSQYNENIDCIMNRECVGVPKESVLDDMIKPLSNYRTTLSSFISSYINPVADLRTLDPENIFFDFVLEKHLLLRKADDDCYSESIYTRIFKAYMYIANVLTNANTMASVAHAFVHQNYVITRQLLHANTIKNRSTTLIDDNLERMKILMLETKWALDQSSREIRNCGLFNLTRGKTFERLNFLTTRFKMFVRPFLNCTESHSDSSHLINSDFELFNCRIFNRGYYHLHIDRGNRERPYHRLNKIDAEEVVSSYGRDVLTNKLSVASLYASECEPQICDAYKPHLVKFSTQYVKAQPGYVVTGMRLRIRDNVIYIDIQQGKFIDETRVDESTVYWKETPKNINQVVSLDRNTRSIVLGDVILSQQYYVTGVMLSSKDGKIIMMMGAQKTDNRGSKLLTESEKIYQVVHANYTTELMMAGCDDPERAPSNLKNVVMRDQGMYYVKFQTTDFEKDLGRTTIPYLDSREVVTKPSAPISGVGIYHEAIPELEVDHPDYPAKTLRNSKSIATKNPGELYVQVYSTDMGKDFGRRTILYLDLQDVVRNPLASIGGIGKYHKAVSGYGGFVGLKMLSLDFCHMVDV